MSKYVHKLPRTLLSVASSSSTRAMSVAGKMHTGGGKHTAVAPQLSREEELRRRQDAMGKLLAEQAVQEAARSAAAVRPAGISHLTSPKTDPVKALAKLRDANREEAADRAAAGGEQGGPAGREPTRFGDWERNGRAFDF